MGTDKAGLKFTLESLKRSQKREIYQQVFFTIPLLSDLLPKKSESDMTDEIYQWLTNYAKSELKKGKNDRVNEPEIIDVWKDYMIPILLNKSVPKQLKANRDLILSELARLGSIIKDADELDSRIESIAKQFLILLFESLGDKDKRDLLEKIKYESAKTGVVLPPGVLTIELIESILKGAAPAALVGIPVIANIALGYLSTGFLATWILPTILGFFGIKLAAISGILAAVAGPIGWGVAGAAILGSVFFAGNNFNNKRNQVIFIQAIFATYSCKYQNRLNNKLIAG